MRERLKTFFILSSGCQDSEAGVRRTRGLRRDIGLSANRAALIEVIK